MPRMTIDDIVRMFWEGRISIFDAVNMMVEAGFETEPQGQPFVIHRQIIRQQQPVIVSQGDDKERMLVGRDVFPSQKEMRKKVVYCDMCGVYVADAFGGRPDAEGRRLCSECVRAIALQKMKVKQAAEKRRNQNDKGT